MQPHWPVPWRLHRPVAAPASAAAATVGPVPWLAPLPLSRRYCLSASGAGSRQTVAVGLLRC